MWSSQLLDGYRPGIRDLICMHVLLLAVPSFLGMSCYLYARNGGGWGLLSRRLRNLLWLGFFWVVVFKIFGIGFSAAFSEMSHQLNETPVFAIFGAFNTIYYFFVCLSVLLVACEIMRRLSDGAVWFWMMATLLLLTALQWLSVASSWKSVVHYWNPLTFLPLVPATILLQRKESWIFSHTRSFFGTVAALIIGSAILEWRYVLDGPFAGFGLSLPPYARISILMSACCILIACLRIKRPAGAIILKMSRLSLALYCLQPFFLALLPEPMNGVFAAALTVAGSYVMAKILKGHILNSRLLQ